jgi:hypothetical protein
MQLPRLSTTNQPYLMAAPGALFLSPCSQARGASDRSRVLQELVAFANENPALILPVSVTPLMTGMEPEVKAMPIFEQALLHPGFGDTGCSILAHNAHCHFSVP